MRYILTCSATETSLLNEMLLVASLDMIFFNKRIAKALIRLRGGAGRSAPLLFVNPRRQGFSRLGPYIKSVILNKCYCI